MELQCEVNRVGPSESHEDLAQVVLSIPPTEGHSSLDEVHTRTTDDSIDYIPMQMRKGDEAGNEDLAIVMRWFLRALASGQVKVLSTGGAVEPRAEPHSLAGTDRARIKPSYVKQTEHLALVTDQAHKPAQHPKLSGTPRDGITTLTAQLAQLRRLHAEAVAIADTLADGLAHAAAADRETEGA
ncbi:hypothetical protein ACFWR9_23520 [Streptomyces sp. NPDC058534]|uniref:hypothetical protein n=1 Tax=Streptomyces sp. NPDC058534 TaxID=3346541 RepID=UPI00364C8639